MQNVLVSIVIRTLNEAAHLDDLLRMIARQRLTGLRSEVVVIDSGSTDGTVEIAERHGCRITTIPKKQFSFGRALNRGSDFALGEILVYISGHCVPVDENWLQSLCQPLLDGTACYAYGRQVGTPQSRFSEACIFANNYPPRSALPQDGYYCNNANAALLRASWDTIRFDESLTGLEDMALAKRLVDAGGRVAYVAEAPVFHHHSESLAGIARRFEREALALRSIVPQIKLRRRDVVKYVLSSIVADARMAARHGTLWGQILPIIGYRIAQYAGSYRGHAAPDPISDQRRDRYFFPPTQEGDLFHAWTSSHRRSSAAQGQQPAGKG